MAQDREVIIPVQEECDEQEKWGKHCIYKLPASITDLKKKAYKPQTISFGPYHDGNPKLRPMECHKSRVLKVFLERSGKSMESCINEFIDVTGELMDAYHTLDRKWIRNPAKFLEMMIRDGCFMLEAMGWYYNYRDAEAFKTRYDESKDPIFSGHGILQMMPFIRRDMLLLENQLPLLLLIKLLSLGGHVKLKDYAEDEKKTAPPPQDKERPIQDLGDHHYVIKLIVNFCNPFTNNLHYEYEGLKNCKHVLDVHRQLLISGTEPKKLSPWSKWYYSWGKLPNDHWEHEAIEYGSNIIPSATRLGESGISIRKSSTKSIKNIQFYAGPLGGVLEIPEIVVDDTTEPVFRNLMAFERMHPGAGHDVTSYVTFMDDIIDNAQDVKILQDHGVLWNAFGSDMAVANLFNSLSKDTTVDLGNDLVRVRYQARKHCKRALNEIWGDLIHVCFNNPRTAIGTLATLLGFGLGITNTAFNSIEETLTAAPPPPF